MSDITLSTADGTVTIPLAMLADNTVRATLEAAFRTVDRESSLAEIWADIDENYSDLNVEAFEIEWCSEYNDEGGYYWALAYASLYGPDETPIEDDEAQDTFRDNLYEVNMERESMPDGIYKRT